MAEELRNVPRTKESDGTDSYSVGYMLKYIGIGENFRFLVDTGRKMKEKCVRTRISLPIALVLLNSYSVWSQPTFFGQCQGN